MSILNLDRIFKPKRIALIGVSTNPNSVSGTILKNIIGSRFNGVVYPVNPDSEAVLGIQSYPDVRQLPGQVDLGVICTPAEQVPEMVARCGEVGILGLIIISAGFRETGAEGRVLEEKIKTKVQKFKGMRILGPNCLGIIVPERNLNISFAKGTPQSGHVAFISQSGALCTSLLDWALEEKIGFSRFVSIGNALDVDFADLIDYFGEDEKTKSIVLYIESINRARKFMTAARASARSKPIIIYKAGRFPESAEVAVSHTGAMAAEDALYDAAFQRAGLMRVLDIGEIFDCTELIGRQKIPHGSRLGIITNAGGPGVIATDALIAQNGELAVLTKESINLLNGALPSAWSHRNPVDVLGDARSKRILKAARIVINDPNVDALLIILTPQAMTNPTTTANAVSQLAAETPKLILAVWLGGLNMREGIGALNDAGIPTYRTPEQAVRAFMTLVKYAGNLESLYETPREIPINFPEKRKKFRTKFKSLIESENNIFSEEISKDLLGAYDIHTTRPYPAYTVDEAVKLAGGIGYPVVLKILSPDITHKTDAGGVKLNLSGETMVRQAFAEIIGSAKKAQPNARISGVTVQKMMDLTNGIELILGAKKDPLFGTVIMVGSGGILAELHNDLAFGFPPLNENLARKMLQSLKLWPLLNGYRNRQPLNLDKLLETLIRFSYLVTDYPEIKELDINPLLVNHNEPVALDARIIIDRAILNQPQKPFAHLTLRPYPEEYIMNKILPDKTKVTLRPIKPEDEPLWFDLLRNCSKESIYMRFRYLFHWDTHDVASRYCFIDYDREIAMVAELNENGSRRLLGVGRLIADYDHTNAEYAVLIQDAWQNRGLGKILTDACMEIAADWGVKKIVAQTTTDNPRMISVFKTRDFNIELDTQTAAVDVSKELEK